MDREKIYAAIRNADAAGDAEAVRKLGQYLQTMQTPGPAEQPPSPTEGMSAAEKVYAGLGKAGSDTWRGLKQLNAAAVDLIPGVDNSAVRQQLRQEADEATRLDAPLMRTGAGIAGNIGGNVAMMALPGGAVGTAGRMAAMPRVAAVGESMIAPQTVRGAAVQGGSFGAVAPTGQNDSAGLNIAAGAAGGAGGQALGKALGRLINPQIGQAVSEPGIPLTLGQQTQSPAIQTVESVLERLPSTSGRSMADKRAQQEAFTRKIMQQFSPAEDASPQGLQMAKQSLSDRYADLAPKTTVNLDQSLMDDLIRVEQEYGKNLPTNFRPAFQNQLDDIINQSGAGMPGDVYQNARSRLGQIANGTSDAQFGRALKGLQKALDDAAERGFASPEDAAAWAKTRADYGKFKTVSKAAKASNADVGSGVLSPKALYQAASSADPNIASKSDEWSRLLRMGRAQVADNVPDSGTAQRMLYQQLLTGGAAGGIGFGATGDPQTAAMSALGVLALPKAAQMALANPQVQNYVTRGVAPQLAQNQVLAALLRQGNTGLGASAALGLAD